MVFPRNKKSPKAGDAEAKEIEAHKNAHHKGKTQSNSTAFPIVNQYAVKEGKVADYEPTENAYRTLREARSEARYAGRREKRAKAKADEAANAKK